MIKDVIPQRDFLILKREEKERERVDGKRRRRGDGKWKLDLNRGLQVCCVFQPAFGCCAHPKAG